MKKYNYLYVTLNKVNSKIYVGVHSTDNLDDYYLGSGYLLRKAIKKYGRENFEKYILMFFDTIEQMNEAERKIVNKDFIASKTVYNVEIGGAGGKVWTDEMRRTMSTAQKNSFKNGRIPPMLGKRHTEYTRKKMKEHHANFFGKNNPMYGTNCEYKMSPEEVKLHRENISKGNKGKRRTKSHRKHYSDYAKKRFWIVNKDGKLGHATSIDDERLKNGMWKMGMKW